MLTQSQTNLSQDEQTKAFPFSVPDYRFDQKNEMFKRAIWDEQVKDRACRLYSEVKHQNRPGNTQLDYALRNAAWNLEYDSGFGNSRGNSGLYSWTKITDKIQRFINDLQYPIEERRL